MSTPNYIEGIKKTGFPLEHEVTTRLARFGWTTINNRYYLDDVQEKPRELDMLAYRVTEGPDNLWIYSAILISCKKSEGEAWGLLSRPRNANDPNIDWHPQHLWTNSPVLESMLGDDWEARYLDFHKDSESLLRPKHHIFAFQQMNKISGKAADDKNIFQSISTLMKALHYEKRNALENRPKKIRVNTYSLLSLVDSDLVRFDFDANSNIEHASTSEELFVSEYIVGRKPLNARIHFVSWKNFDGVIRAYNRLHEDNVTFFTNEHERFYSGFRSNPDPRIEVIAKRLRSALRNEAWFVKGAKVSELIPAAEDLSAQFEKGILRIGPIDKKFIEFVNSNSKAKIRISGSLKQLLHYEGEWQLSEFDFRIPF